MTENGCKTEFIDDVPKNEDAFSGGHRDLAKAIADVIKRPNGKTIGIEGGWGSGKSSIITMLKDKIFEEDTNYKFFIFDTWAHEGDTLRRSFLYNLLDTLKKWIEEVDEKWGEDKKNELEGKKATITRTTSTTFKSQSILAVAATATIAIGAAYVKKGLETGVVPYFTGQPNYYYIIGISLAFSVLIITYATNWWLLKFKKKNTTGLFSDVTDTDTIVTSLDSPKLTSFEFENLFKEIIAKALNNEKKKLIIVVDNLDRIPPKQALEILSTLQIFLQHSQQHENEKQKYGKELTQEKYIKLLKQVWVLIPYDYDGLKKLWKPEKNGDEELARKMLEKRFQIRFWVPPIVASDWKKYFVDNLKFAFDEHKENLVELNDVYQVVRLTFLKSRSADKERSSDPTPREIINIINQMGTLHLQWCRRNIKLEEIAFYATYRYLCPSKDFSQELLKDDFIPSEILSFLPDDWQDHLAMLWFNVEASKARELLLKSSLLTILKDHDDEKFNSLFSKNPHAISVLSIITTDDLTSSFGYLAKFLNISSLISKTTILNQAPLAEQTNIQNKLEKHFIDITEFQAINLETMNRIEGFLTVVSNDKIIQKIFDFLSRPYNILKATYNPETKSESLSINTTHYSYAKGNEVGEWVDAAIKFISLASEANSLSTNKIIIPALKMDLIYVFAEINKKDPGQIQLNHFDFEDTFSKIQESLLSFINEPTFNEYHLGAIKFIVAKDKSKEVNWVEIVDHIQTKFDSLAPDVFMLAIELERLLMYLYGKFDDLRNVIDSTFAAIGKRGELLAYFYKAHKDGNAQRTAYALYLILKFGPVFDLPPNSRYQETTKGFNLIYRDLYRNPTKHNILNQAILEILIFNKDLNILFSILEAKIEAHAWVNEIFYLLSTTQQKHADLLNLNNIIKLASKNHDPFFKKHLSNEKYTSLITCLIEHSQLLEYIRKDTDIPFTELAGFVADLFNNGAGKNRSFREWSKKQLQDIDTGVWVTSFRGDDSYQLRGLLKSLVENNYSPKQNQKFSNAILEIAKEIVSKKSGTQIPSADWNIYFESFAESRHRDELQETLVEIAINTPEIPDKYFIIFGNELKSIQALKKHDRTVSGLFTKIIEKPTSVRLTWLSTTLKRNNLLTKEPKFKEDFNNLKERAKQKIEELSNETLRSDLERIIKILN